MPEPDLHERDIPAPHVPVPYVPEPGLHVPEPHVPEPRVSPGPPVPEPHVPARVHAADARSRPPQGSVPRLDLPRARLFLPSRAWGGRRRREILFASAAIAVLFHVALTVLLLEAPHLWPMPSPPPPKAGAAQDPATIEMVMDKARYTGGAKPTPPAPPSPPTPKTSPSPPQPPDKPPESLDTPPAQGGDAMPPPAPPSDTQAKQPPAPPQAPPAQAPSSPQVNLDPADGLGYGEQDDPHVVPAKPDNARANKMPPYPPSAGRRGEEGSVQMLTSIDASGDVTAVEIAVSSGHADLDRTARNAVLRWHFRPAMQAGRPVPTQMMQVFNFKIDR